LRSYFLPRHRSLELIRLSKTTDYGFLAIEHLLTAPDGEYRSAREIAARHNIPPALMAKLLQRLARKGLVASHHGIKGGYQIARPASEITLMQIIEALEGPVAAPACRHVSREECRRSGTCDGCRPGRTVQRKIAEVLERTTLRDLALLQEAVE
jgi:Rrf2 family protein